MNPDTPAEREYRRMNFRLSLSADELDWLLETLGDVARRFRMANQISNALDVEGSIRTWGEEVADQGYRLAALAAGETCSRCGRKLLGEICPVCGDAALAVTGEWAKREAEDGIDWG